MLPKFDTSEADGVPYDIVTPEKTLVVGRDPELDLLNRMLTVEERTGLRLILERYGAYQRHKRLWNHTALRAELESLRGMLSMFEIFAVSEDAKAQLALWNDKL